MLQSLAEILKTVFSKIGDFFDIFDISYLVAGVVALGAILFWIDHRLSIFYDLRFDGIAGPLIFIGCYVIGLVCTALGRKLNHRIPGFNKYSHLQKTLIESRLHEQLWFKEQLISLALPQPGPPYTEDSLRAVYRQLWTLLRERKDVPESLSLMRRYWVNSATLDGLTFAAGLWVMSYSKNIIEVWWDDGKVWWNGILLVILILVALFQVGREANRYRRYQVEELVNTYILIKSHS